MKIQIIKSKMHWNKKYPYIVIYGDIRASFKTKKEAQSFAKKEMKKYSINPITFMVEKEKESHLPYTENELGKQFKGLKKGYKKSKKTKSLLHALP